MRGKRLILLAVFAICGAKSGLGQDLDLAALGARAEAGDPAAQVELGHAYRRAGLGAVAADWYCRAAALDFPEGLYRCAAGRDIALLTRAASLGHAPSALALGRLAEPEDAALAARHFARAAELGSGSGAYRAGLLAERRGDIQAAREFWRAAVERGHWPAANDLALSLLNEPTRPAGAEPQARALLARAAQAGDQTARFNLAELSADDPERAYRLYALAGAGPSPGLRAAAIDRLAALERGLAPARIAELRARIAPEIALTRELASRPADAPD
jgi:TPR repeat protein